MLYNVSIQFGQRNRFWITSMKVINNLFILSLFADYAIIGTVENQPANQLEHDLTTQVHPRSIDKFPEIRRLSNIGAGVIFQILWKRDIVIHKQIHLYEMAGFELYSDMPKFYCPCTQIMSSRLIKHFLITKFAVANSKLLQIFAA